MSEPLDLTKIRADNAERRSVLNKFVSDNTICRVISRGCETVDSLIDEVERLRAELAATVASTAQFARDMANNMRAIEVDARRWKWCEENSIKKAEGTHWPTQERHWVTVEIDREPSQSFAAAVDAAIEEGKARNDREQIPKPNR